jgi:hypothetical protein
MDDAWVKQEVDRHLIFQHGDLFQRSREELEQWVRSPDYVKQKAEWKRLAAEQAPLLREAEAIAREKARALGVEDWSPFYVEERERQKKEKGKIV